MRIEEALRTIATYKKDRDAVMQGMQAQPCYAIDKEIWTDIVQFVAKHKDDIVDNVGDYGDLEAVLLYAKRNGK